MSQVAWHSIVLPIYSDRGPCSATWLRSRGLHLSRALQCDLSYLIVRVKFAFTEVIEGLDLDSDQVTYFKASVSLDRKDRDSARPRSPDGRILAIAIGLRLSCGSVFLLEQNLITCYPSFCSVVGSAVRVIPLDD